MKQEYILNIDNPCKEDWNLMKHEGNGRFCSNCSKKVIDFTTLSDSEIVKLLEKNTSRLCGNLNTDQLNRTISIQESKSTPSFYKLLAGLLLLGSTKNLQATNSTSIKTEISKPINKEELPSSEIGNTENPTDSLIKIVQGVVLDSVTKEPIIGAIIKLKNTNKAVATDIEGKFKITIPNDLPIDSITLIVRYIGYKSTEFKIDKTNLTQKIDLLKSSTDSNNLNTLSYGCEIRLSPVALIGEIVIVRKAKRKWWQRKEHTNSSHK